MNYPSGLSTKRNSYACSFVLIFILTAFGAFVNIGIKENGLIHKSNLAETYVEDPAQFISLHEHVSVQVLEVDVARKRVGLKKM
jgi:uncharacterized protein